MLDPPSPRRPLDVFHSIEHAGYAHQDIAPIGRDRINQGLGKRRREALEANARPVDYCELAVAEANQAALSVQEMIDRLLYCHHLRPPV